VVTPELTVAAIAERDGQFLVIEEWVKGRLCFNQPAGHLEPGETLPDAVVRETLEESGYRFRPEAIVGSYLWQSSRTGDLIMRVVFCGRCEDSPARQTLDDGIVAAHWMTLEGIKALGEQLRSPLVVKALADYQAGRRLPLDAVTWMPNRVA
jgi:8-oxo-dGTP pyrophosphatase MutT (NUDIX family)